MSFKFKVVCLLAIIFSSCEWKSNIANRQIFIWTKDSGTKNSTIVKNLNSHGGTNSHIGISLELDEPVIYNVDFLKNDSLHFLHKMSMEEFDDCTNSTAVYAVNVTSTELQNLKNRLDKILQMKISYDFDFSLDVDSSYYCSEFAYDLLRAANETRFFYKPQKTKLKGLSKLMLQREELSYIPADFFLSYNESKKLTIVQPVNQPTLFLQ